MKLHDFIPDNPDKSDPDFNAKINAKKEFQKYAEVNEQVDPIYFNHQKLNQVFMAAQSSNTKLFVYKDAGIGKTCDVIGMAESRHEWLNQITKSKDANLKLNTNKALIIAQNKTGRDDSFKKDIIGRCTAGAYITDNLKGLKQYTTSGRAGAETTSIQKSYDLETHQAFGNKIAKMSESQIAKEHSFRVVIIDEVHMLKDIITGSEREKSDGTIRTDDDEFLIGKKNSYNNIARFLRNIYGGIIIVMSATPVVNSIYEFPSIINFVTDKDSFVDPTIFNSLMLKTIMVILTMIRSEKI